MKYCRLLVPALVLIAATGPVFAKGDVSVSVDYAGFGFNTQTHTVEDEFPVNISQVTGKGTFGKSSIAITVEFAVDPDVLPLCPDGYVVPMTVVESHTWAVTITAADNSQVVGLFNEGWMCLTQDMVHYYGEASGDYIGGSGRYEDVTGEWVSTYEGMNLDPSIGFRSMTGDLKGVLYIP